MESTLSTPCSRSDPPLSCEGAALAHLDSLPPHDLVLWTDDFILYPIGQRGSGVLANCCLSVALRPLFPFRQVPYVQVFPLKPAPFCTLFAGRDSTNKSAISLLLLSDSRSVLATLLSPPSFLFPQTLGKILQELSSPFVLSDYNGSPDTRFSRETTRLMSWSGGEASLLAPSAIFCRLSSRKGSGNNNIPEASFKGFRFIPPCT